jgi:hypothetical protein
MQLVDMKSVLEVWLDRCDSHQDKLMEQEADQIGK